MMDQKILLAQRVQQMLSIKEELADYVSQWAERVRDPQLAERLRQAAPEFTKLTGNLLRCLQMLDTPIDDIRTTALISAFAYDDAQVLGEDDTPQAIDIHFITSALAIGGMEVALYDAMLTMADALGEEGVADLLRENREHDQDDIITMRTLLNGLLGAGQGQSHAA